MLQAVFEQGLGRPRLGLPLGWRVSRCTWRAVGGPAQAELAADLPAGLTLVQLAELLGCPVKLYDAARLAWWGWVERVEVWDGAIGAQASLQEMANRVAVYYSHLATGQTGSGQPTLTGWAESAYSLARYGRKEHVLPLGQANPAQAEAARGLYLSEHEHPQMQARLRATPARREVRLSLRGWWDTLDWVYASQPPGLADVETTAQIHTLAGAAAGGQFLAGVRIEASSGIVTNPYRDGLHTCREGVEELLNTGTSTGQRLLAQVTPQRWLRVYPQPSPNVLALRIGPDGCLRDAGGRLLGAGDAAAGHWAGLAAPALQLSAGAQLPVDRLFVWEVAYDGQGLRVTATGLG